MSADYWVLEKASEIGDLWPAPLDAAPGFSNFNTFALRMVANRWQATKPEHVNARRDDHAPIALLLRQTRQDFEQA